MNKYVSKEEFLNYIESMEKRNKESINKIVLFILDIDNSKKIFGDSINPRTINVITSAIDSSFNNCVYSQVGRDSFSILFEGKYDIFNILDKNKILKRYIKLNSIPTFTYSLGIAIYPEHTKKFDELFSLALEALYLAKQKGNDGVGLPNDEPMKLKSIYFRKVQIEKLSELSKRTNKTESHLIRQALDEYLKKKFIDY